MRDFFKGWQRKVGIITLLTACLTMVFWIRSYQTLDSLFFHFGEWRFGVSSVDHRIWLLQTTTLLTEPWCTWGTGDYEGPFDPMDGADVTWRVDWHGFHFGDYTRQTQGQTATGTFRAASCMIPHWAIILPLTLLSGSLILWPRRKSSTLTPPPDTVARPDTVPTAH